MPNLQDSPNNQWFVIGNVLLSCLSINHEACMHKTTKMWTHSVPEPPQDTFKTAQLSPLMLF